MQLFNEITEENFLLFAAKNYYNPRCIDAEELYEDLKRFKYLKRLIKRYQDGGKLAVNLIMNHLVVIFNVFGVEAATTLLLFKIEPEFWDVLKTFMIFLNALPEGELQEVEENIKVKEVLEKL